ncbi:MAG: NAD-dependent dehydratase [Friedmanniella sp.]|nr:NAD-dependent dehydratase [Friedmanniella sp.]
MSALKVLFIGGTGIISSACVRRALDVGIDLTVLTRGRSTSLRPLPEGVTVVTADTNDRASLTGALSGSYDAVVDWVAFTPDQVQRDIEVFGDRTSQFVFISSASAYQTPPSSLPVRESTPLRNPFWQYSRDKIACEELLMSAYRDSGFPVTIVRPSHTYDKTLVPFDGGWTVMERMRQGKGVVVPGDGTSLWTLTHHTDFAVGFVGLLGRREAIGQPFHITGDDALPWNEIYQEMAFAAGVEADLVHVASDAINLADPEWGAGMLGDKSHSMIFDNTKIKALVPDFAARIPFSQGAREIVAWYDADPARRTVDAEIDATMDRLVEAYRPRSLP